MQNPDSGYIINDQYVLRHNGNSTNIFVGVGADALGDNLTNAAAIGANARVSTSNSLVLGGTGDAAVKVGIGTAAPGETLDISGTIKITSLACENCHVIADKEGKLYAKENVAVENNCEIATLETRIAMLEKKVVELTALLSEK